MSGWILYFFFMLDSFKTASEVFLILSIVLLVVGLIIYGIGYAVGSDHLYSDKPGEALQRTQAWCKRWVGIWKWWRRILIPVFCVSLLFQIALPNTKQAVAIYVIPKVINAAAQNKELMELPQDVVKVAKLYLNKVMVKWSEDIEKDLSPRSIDSTNIVTMDDNGSTPLSKAEKVAKDTREAYDKAMQALEAAKKASDNFTK
jgi:hypothetical protein